jgi:hypothetical protein
MADMNSDSPTSANSDSFSLLHRVKFNARDIKNGFINFGNGNSAIEEEINKAQDLERQKEAELKANLEKKKSLELSKIDAENDKRKYNNFVDFEEAQSLKKVCPPLAMAHAAHTHTHT